VLLGNLAPALQNAVLDQLKKPRFVVADSMDLWINIALDELLRLLKRIDGFVLNDSEAQLLTKEDNVFLALKKLHKLGPKYVIIKQGSHGSILSGPKGHFICPAYPLAKVEGSHGRRRFLCGRLDGLSGRRARVRRCQYPAGHGLWQCHRVLLLRGLWLERHHQDQTGGD
jgi:hypothetical protein